MDLMPEILSIAVLVVMFVVATVRGVNMGVLGFIAAAAIGGLVLGMAPDEYLAGFPIDLFVTLLGLTFLFGFAQHNGAIEVVVHAAMRLLGGRTWLAPWLFFALTAALIAIGALFAVAIIAPLAMAFARRSGLNLLMTGVMVVHGALAGAFSPLSVYGVFVADFLTSNGFEPQPLTLFLAPFAANTVFALAVFLVLRGRRGIVEADADAPDAEGTAGVGGTATATATATRVRPDGIQTLTLVGLAVMVVGVVAFGIDIGILSLCIGAVIGIVRPAHAPVALSKVSWSVVVLITGVLTYIAVLEAAGTVDWVGDGIASIGVPLAATALLFLLAGVVSALASSLGIIGVVLALSLPFLQQGEVALGGFLAGLAFAATIVDISPFSTNGAMLLASTEGPVRDRLYRHMLVYAGLMVAVGPAVGWLMVALPTAFGG